MTIGARIVIALMVAGALASWGLVFWAASQRGN